MASVVGHSLSGVLVAQVFGAEEEGNKRRWLVCAAVFLALLPDLDIVVYLLFRPQGFTAHRGASHGIFFALMVSCACFLLLRRCFTLSTTRLFSCFASAAILHPVLDFLMGAGPAVPFFAPFFEVGFLAPIKLIPTAYYATHLSGLVGLLTYGPTWLGVTLEIFIFAPAILMLHLHQRKGSSILRFALALLALTALGLTWRIYN